jgi:murein L,D-transpeptidase YcbB/YkuD
MGGHKKLRPSSALALRRACVDGRAALSRHRQTGGSHPRTVPPAIAAAVLAVSVTALGGFITAVAAAASEATPEISASPAMLRAELQKLIGRGLLPGARHPNFSEYRGYVTSFYAAQDYAPAWVRNGHVSDQARAMIALFRDAAKVGLDPQSYDSSRWDARLASIEGRAAAPNVEDLARFDLSLTVAALRYICDVHIGRAHPGYYDHGLEGVPKKVDVPEFLRNQVLNASDVASVLGALEPPYAGYRRAKSALAEYLRLAREGDPAPLPVLRDPVRPGDDYAWLPLLADRLRQLGGLSANEAPSAGATTYEGAVVDAVKRFQRRHGLEIDCVIDEHTIAELNTPLRDRVRQPQLTLERYRWIPPEFPEPPIEVNIPEFRLRTLRSQNTPVLSMRVQVGRAYRSETPLFAGELRYVVFNPYWDVPRSIARNELVPEAERDRGYLARRGFEVLDDRGRVVSEGEVSDDILERLLNGTYRLRQKPGPMNALGKAKFIFPNNYHVYLHDTPAHDLFARARRDFSHGCIRLESPEALAIWVLRNKPGWTPERVGAAFKGARTVQVDFGDPIPVLILYATAWVEPGGEVQFFADIYGHDAALERLLAERD